MSRKVIIDELEFETPYGKVAAKTWHEETDQAKRILVLHGWMDNAGSFDNLMPLLKHKDGLYIVALDLPGHGRSSQMPPGSSYTDMNIILEIRRCIRELKWNKPVPKKRYNGGVVEVGAGAGLVSSASHDSIASSTSDNCEPHKKFTIIGHSLGAGLAMFYSSLYPDEVEEVISIDCLKVKTPTPEQLIANTANTIDTFIDTVPAHSPFASPVLPKSSLNSNNLSKTDKGQVIVSQEAAIIATIEAHKILGTLTRDDATCLLKRSTITVSHPPNSVIYSRDLRLQSMPNLRDNMEIQKIMYGRIKCHVLVLLGTQGMYASNKLYSDRMDEAEEFYKERVKSFHLQYIEGDHYFHMNKSQETAELINRFLEDPAAFKVKRITPSWASDS